MKVGQIYLIRHGQAGARDNYDVLSEVGCQQAKLLGEHLASQGLKLSAAYAGAMNRQRLTAEIVCGELVCADNSVPDIVSDDRWNEFSLAEVYKAIVGRMKDDCEMFAGDFEEMQEVLRRDPHATGGAAGRCDAAVVRAWMENRYPDYQGESWASFRRRIQARASALAVEEDGGNIAVFTSATPIAISVGAALDLSDERLLGILGVLYNAGVTVMRPWRGELRLFTFNSVSHLPSELCTLR
ncbi:MAG TPA: histidine phosphatase family protein [Blastocatellia bacterium]|nr:histidine phosphatase family protein [Blastocatellia bacterium]